MSETTLLPSQIPAEALTLSDRMKRVEQAQTFFAELTKCLASRARGEADSDAQKFSTALQRAFAPLESYLTSFGQMPLLVEGNALMMFDNAVCQSAEPVSIAGRLGGEGICQLTFMPGIALDELNRFSRAITAPLGRTACADLLWEAGLPHILLDFAEEFAVPGMSPASVSAEVNRVMESLFGALRENTGDLRRILQGDPAETEFHGEIPPKTVVIAGCPAGEDLRSRVQASLAETEAAARQRALDRVFDLLESGKSDRPDSLEKFFTGLTDMLLREGDLAGIGAIVRRISAMEYESALAMTGYRLRCALQAQFSKPERLNVVCALLVQGELDDPESVQLYLNTLDDSAVVPLIELLPSISAEENRRLVRSALSRAGKGLPDPFVAAFRSGKGQIVRDMLAIIDECDFPEKFDCFGEALQGRDKALQLEAVSLLAQKKNLASEQSVKMLCGALKSDQAAIRMAALKGLQECGSSRVGSALLEVMQQDVFDKRDHDERRTFFDVLGTLNLPAALPFLSQILSRKKRGFFGGARLREDKLLAIHALSKMMLIPSYKILQGAAEDESNDGKVREEAKAACAAMKRALFGEGK